MDTITVRGKTYKLPKKPVWRQGPPPEIGWWPASISGDAEILRWWNGSYWSGYVLPHFSENLIASTAARKSPNQGGIEWTNQWWKEKRN